MFSLLFSFCFCGKDLSSFSCIFSFFNIFFFVSDKKKITVWCYNRLIFGIIRRGLELYRWRLGRRQGRSIRNGSSCSPCFSMAFNDWEVALVE